jgi:hypothetical protein
MNRIGSICGPIWRWHYMSFYPFERTPAIVYLEPLQIFAPKGFSYCNWSMEHQSAKQSAVVSRRCIQYPVHTGADSRRHTAAFSPFRPSVPSTQKPARSTSLCLHSDNTSKPTHRPRTRTYTKTGRQMTERRQVDSPPSKLPRLSGADANDGRWCPVL